MIQKFICYTKNKKGDDMKIIQCSRCGSKILRGFPCPVCNPKDKAFHLQTYLALREEEFKLLKKELKNIVDESTYQQIMTQYNHKLQQLRKDVYPFLHP